MSRIVDGVLKDWGDRVLPEKVYGRRPKNLRGGNGRAKQARASTIPPRSRFALTVGRAPEVVVKISGGGRNTGTIRAHLDYISRHGKLEVEDESGMLLQGRKEMRDILTSWERAHAGIPETGEGPRQAFNIILSMPPGTSREAVRAAAKAFAVAEFAENHQYVFAEHRDTAHPHVHMVVKAIGRDGVRLNPRKADLQRWRERFAEALRVQGVLANATPRRARGVRKRATRQAVLHIEARGAPGRRTSRPSPPPGFSPAVANAYREAGRALAVSASAEDQALAREVEAFGAPGTLREERKLDKTGRE